MPVTIPKIASVRLNDRDREYLDAYVKIEKKPLGQLLKEALLEKVDDYYDIREANEVIEEIEKTPSRVRPWSEFEKEFFDNQK